MTERKEARRLSFILVAVYLIITLIIAGYSFVCSGMYCGLWIVLPVMPWALIFEKYFPDNPSTDFFAGAGQWLSFVFHRMGPEPDPVEEIAQSVNFSVAISNVYKPT